MHGSYSVTHTGLSQFFFFLKVSYAQNHLIYIKKKKDIKYREPHIGSTKSRVLILTERPICLVPL